MTENIAIAVGVVLVIVLAPWFISKVIEPIIHNRRVKKARADLSAHGLTPERYLKTLDPSDTEGLARAKVRYGIE